ncbi:MAG: hypothetical protein AAGF12_12765 [Myxococcota bacterium]
MQSRLAAAALLVWGAACSGDEFEVQPRSLNQSSALAFVCYAEDSMGVVPGGPRIVPAPQSACAPAAPNEPPRFLSPLRHALLTQEGRGEVAAVDLDSERILDSNLQVPGFTFVTAVELPTDIVIPDGTEERPPRFAYVAGSGSRDILALPLGRFPEGEPDNGLLEQRLSVSGSGAPKDLALSEDGTRLFATIPEAGLVLAIALDEEGNMGAVSPLILDPTVPEGVAAAPRPVYCADCTAPEEPASLEALCNDPFDRGQGPEPLLPREPVSLGATPRPSDLEVAGNLLLVADADLPVIHRIDIETLALLPSFNVGVPTTEVVMTPLVPALPDDMEATEQFIYAIDAVTSEVLVADATTGAVLPVSRAPTTIDRVNLPTPAVALGVLTPGTPENEADDDVLNGVFVAVLDSRGAVRIIDVHDADVSRRIDEVCDTSEFFGVARHRARLLDLDEPVSLSGTPSITTDANVGQDPIEFAEFTTCPPDMIQAFPDPDDEGQPEVCAMNDPWVARSEIWTADWEGVIPATAGARGRMMPPTGETARFEGEVPFCDRGVLGADTGVSDLLVLLGPLPPGPEVPAACDPFRDDLEDSGLRRIAFPIQRSFNGVLEVGLTERNGQSWQTAFDCFGNELVSYEIRAGGSYTVLGSSTGFEHDVVPDPMAATPEEASCVRATANPFTSRAFVGAVFDNGRVQFQLNGTPPVDSETTATFTLADAPAPLAASVGQNLSEVKFDEISETMLVLDFQIQGLTVFDLDPFGQSANID